MQYATKILAAGLAAAAFAAPAIADAEREDLAFDAFVATCDADRDGMVSKAEAMRQIEKMFDRQDTKKMGKLDKRQFEIFLKELMKSGA